MPHIPGPVPAETDRIGAYSTGSMQAMLFSGDQALIGVKGGYADPRHFDRPSIPGSHEGWVRSGLVELDLKTGATRTYTSEDGVPRAAYVELTGDQSEHTASFLDLAWIEEGTSFAGASWRFVTRAEKQNGVWTFTRHNLRSPNSTEDALVTFVEVVSGELFVGSDQGVAVLDPVSMQLLRWIDFVVMTDPWVYAMTSGELDGQRVVAVAFASQKHDRSTTIGVLRPSAAQSENLYFMAGEEPTALLGMKNAILVGVMSAALEGSLHAVTDGASGLAMNQVMAPAELGATSFGNLIPNRLAFDERRRKLLVGGRIQPQTLSGGGLVAIDATEDGVITGAPTEVIAPEDLYSQAVPVHVELLAVDAQGRYWVGGRSLCNVHKLRNAGFWRIEPQEGEPPRLVRPIVSGVRSMAVDPVVQDTWLGLRDESPALACEAVNVMQGLCRLRKDGSCEIYATSANSGDAAITATPAPTSIAFGDPARKEMALATIREATWLRTFDNTWAHMTQLDPGLNLRMTRAAWGEKGALWLGSVMDYQPQVGPGLDDEGINDRSPHGLGYLELDDDGAPAFSRRYVRKLGDPNDARSIPGLPSHTVWDVIPLEKARTALVACGIEREVPAFDHMLGQISRYDGDGGLAIVDDAKVELVPPPQGITFGDVVALAKRPGGGFLALDADHGIFTVDVENRTTALWAAPAWEPPVRGKSLAVDASGRVAVGTTAGLVVYGADRGTTWITTDGVRGHVWTVQFRDDGLLYAGDDQGLLRVAFGSASLPDLGPEGPLPREIWPFPVPCGVEGCVCRKDPDCTGGLVCGCDGTSCSCQAPDPCRADPGQQDCACAEESDCVTGLGCACDLAGKCSCQPLDPCVSDPGGAGCTCQPNSSSCTSPLTCLCSGSDCACQLDPGQCTGTSGCPCTDVIDCPDDFYCHQAVGQCALRQPCDANCTCSSPSTCSPGLACQSGWAGRSCI